MSKTKWREEDDPEVLAAAVAAGVKVQYHDPRWSPGEWWEVSAVPVGGFQRFMVERNITYRIPAGWSPDVPPADDLRERIARAAAGGYMRVPTDALDGMYLGPPWLDVADAVLAVLPAQPVVPPSGDENDNIARLTEDQGDRIVNACCRMLGCEPADIDGDAALEEILTEAVERCADLHGQDRWEDDCHGCGFRVGDHTTDGRCPAAPSPVPPWPDGVLRDAANRLRWIANSGYIEDPGIKRIIRSWADELDATLVPPWPGAVLSGLVDEDGVPTWLAQAGQVRGEQVRRRSDLVWVNNDQMVAFSDTVWVEVRDPRAVPEPETERVPWWEALGRIDPNDGRIVAVEHLADRSPRVYFDPQTWVDVTRPDGTVEVLKDGES